MFWSQLVAERMNLLKNYLQVFEISDQRSLNHRLIQPKTLITKVLEIPFCCKTLFCTEPYLRKKFCCKFLYLLVNGTFPSSKLPTIHLVDTANKIYNSSEISLFVCILTFVFETVYLLYHRFRYKLQLTQQPS